MSECAGKIDGVGPDAVDELEGTVGREEDVCIRRE